MKFTIEIPVTRLKRCPEGYYALINGSRLHFLARSKAIDGIRAFLSLQRIQVVTVRQYAKRNKRRLPR